MKNVVKERQQMVERIDIYTTIKIDMKNVTHAYEDCFFKTNDHYIRYDVKKNQFRRRKKNIGSHRYYTHYVGKLKYVESLSCFKKEKTMMFKFKFNTTEHIWDFYLNDH